MTTYDLVAYYQNLLINQFNGLPKASGHIAAIAGMAILPQLSTFSVTFTGTPSSAHVPTSGSFTLSWGGNTTVPIAYNATTSDVTAALVALPGINGLSVLGTTVGNPMQIIFLGNPPPVSPVTVASNTLSSGFPVVVTVVQTDLSLPLAIQNAFNLTKAPYCSGAQLDMLGKYAGVKRTGNGFTSVITLSDADYLSLIQIAIITNNAGSSLATIQQLLANFFPNKEILVFDAQNMTMSYVISATVGSQNLMQLFVQEGLLPKPMGVTLSAVIYVPVATNLFGLRTYTIANPNATPMNTYTSYNTNWQWLSYANAVQVNTH